MVGDQQKKYPLWYCWCHQPAAHEIKWTTLCLFFLPLFDNADEIVEHPLVGHHGALTKASYLLQIIKPYTPVVVELIFYMYSDTATTSQSPANQYIRP
jgi:hypothetical protein